MQTDWRRLREKLRDAADAAADEQRTLRERLTSAYLYGLSGLEPEDFPDNDGRAEFVALREELTKSGEAIEGAGSVPTTAWLLSDDAATTIAARIVALAKRYEAL